MRTRIKFCGMTRPGDVRLAGELGADAIGLVFAPGGPRALTLDHAMALREAAPPFVSVVALFMDNPAEEVERIVKAVRPHLLQFHGGEGEGHCRRFGLPYFKAIAMGGGVVDAKPPITRYPSSAGFVFDGHGAGEPGGQGKGFDWSRLAHPGRPWLLAGGLGPHNVAAAVAAVRPWGVDVSSGIESAPGIKDGEKMAQFVNEVRRADGSAAAG